MADINIGDAEISKIRFLESANPSTPASGYGYLFLATDGLFKTINDSGTLRFTSNLYAKLSDVKAANTGGGTFTSGAWRTRTLNTEYDPDNIVTLSANQFTLESGTYRISARAPGYNVNRHKIKLYNVSDATDTLIGSSAFTPTSNVQTDSIMYGEFTIAAQKIFEIQHRCQTTSNTIGFGNESNFGVDEVYTVVEIWKVR